MTNMPQVSCRSSCKIAFGCSTADLYRPADYLFRLEREDPRLANLLMDGGLGLCWICCRALSLGCAVGIAIPSALARNSWSITGRDGLRSAACCQLPAFPVHPGLEFARWSTRRRFCYWLNWHECSAGAAFHLLSCCQNLVQCPIKRRFAGTRPFCSKAYIRENLATEIVSIQD